MGFFDKLRNKTTSAKGRAKENIGRHNRDPKMTAEGRKERVEGGVKQVGEQVKDAAKDIRRSVD